MFTLWGDGVLWAAGCVGLAAVAAGALQGISAGAVDVQLEAAGQSSGQLLTGLPVHLSVRHTHRGICELLGFVCPIRMLPVSHVTFYSRTCLAFCWSLCPTLGDDEVLFPLPLFGSSPGVVTSAPWWLLGSVVSLLSLLLFRVLTMGWSYGPGLAQSYTGRYHQ